MAGEQTDNLDGGLDGHHPLRSYLPWLVLAAGALLSVMAFFLVRDWERALNRAEFEIFSATHASALHRELIRHMDATIALMGLYDASQEVDRDEFRQFASGILKQHNDIDALMWLPRVAPAQRAALERRALAEGLRDFHIREPAGRDTAARAPEQEDVFPVFYVQPMESGIDLWGVDLMADPAYRDVLERARDTGEVASSGPIYTVSAQGPGYGILLARAVYEKDAALGTAVERRVALQGFVLHMFRVGSFVEESLDDVAVLGLDLSVLYEKAPGNPRLIYFRPSPSRAEPGAAPRELPGDGNGLTWQVSLGLQDQPWSLAFTPAPKFWSTHPVWRSWVVSGTGLLISILLGTYSFRLLRESQRAESLARNLARTNKSLLEEILERGKIEAQAVKLSRAIEQSADAVMITGREGVIEYVNPAFEEMTGYAREETIGKKPSMIKSGRHDAQFYGSLWQTIKQGRVFQDVFINRRKNGVLYYEEKTITPLKDRDGDITHFIATGKDITERMRTQERLHHLAYHDLLTDLPNRLQFLERLGQALKGRHATRQRLAILCLDLDRFKVINDTLGHQTGDALLQKIAAMLPSAVDAGGTVARLGGDEFGVLLEDVSSLDVVAAQTRKILALFARPFVIGGHELYIAPSIGISVYPEDGDDANALLKNADVAMYRAKEQGGNNYQYYSADMSSQSFQRLTLETSLRRALEREEFRVYYQPQIGLQTGEVMGVEALLRWQHPDLGLVSPLEFIPLLEETGLIVPVGEWVLRQSCNWAAGAQKDGAMRVSVNLSGRQFRDAGLGSLVAQILAESKLAADKLEMEITESVLMQGDKISAENIQELDRLGVRLAIDDFGTGYSSLSYLKRIPIKTLKIDRAFIRDVNVDQDDAAIVTAIIAMANSLKLEVVAEGVENAQQLDFLRRTSCGAMQGFLVSNALPVDEIDRFLAKGRRVLEPAHAPASSSRR